jgi:hypothetical protein
MKKLHRSVQDHCESPLCPIVDNKAAEGQVSLCPNELSPRWSVDDTYHKIDQWDSLPRNPPSNSIETSCHEVIRLHRKIPFSKILPYKTAIFSSDSLRKIPLRIPFVYIQFPLKSFFSSFHFLTVRIMNHTILGRLKEFVTIESLEIGFFRPRTIDIRMSLDRFFWCNSSRSWMWFKWKWWKWITMW